MQGVLTFGQVLLDFLLSCCLIVCLFVYGTEDGSQGLVRARQVHYH
jgi:hypothetical protein